MQNSTLPFVSLQFWLFQLFLSLLMSKQVPVPCRDGVHVWYLAVQNLFSFDENRFSSSQSGLWKLGLDFENPGYNVSRWNLDFGTSKVLSYSFVQIKRRRAKWNVDCQTVPTFDLELGCTLFYDSSKSNLFWTYNRTKYDPSKVDRAG